MYEKNGGGLSGVKVTAAVSTSKNCNLGRHSSVKLLYYFRGAKKFCKLQSINVTFLQLAA